MVNMNSKWRKLFGIFLYTLSGVAAIILIKTEFRKWVVFAGDATPANTLIFWFSAIGTVVFGWIGSKIYPHKNN